MSSETSYKKCLTADELKKIIDNPKTSRDSRITCSNKLADINTAINNAVQFRDVIEEVKILIVSINKTLIEETKTKKIKTTDEIIDIDENVANKLKDIKNARNIKAAELANEEQKSLKGEKILDDKLARIRSNEHDINKLKDVIEKLQNEMWQNSATLLENIALKRTLTLDLEAKIKIHDKMLIDYESANNKNYERVLSIKAEIRQIEKLIDQQMNHFMNSHDSKVRLLQNEINNHTQNLYKLQCCIDANDTNNLQDVIQQLKDYISGLENNFRVAKQHRMAQRSKFKNIFENDSLVRFTNSDIFEYGLLNIIMQFKGREERYSFIDEFKEFIIHDVYSNGFLVSRFIKCMTFLKNGDHVLNSYRDYSISDDGNIDLTILGKGSVLFCTITKNM